MDGATAIAVLKRHEDRAASTSAWAKTRAGLNEHFRPEARSNPVSTLSEPSDCAEACRPGGQSRRSYILHPLRMMLRMTTTDECIVAVLHDVCEDCPGWTFERLRSEGSPITCLQRSARSPSEGEDSTLRPSCADNPIGRASNWPTCTTTATCHARRPRATSAHRQYRRAIAFIGGLEAANAAREPALKFRRRARRMQGVSP